MLNMQGIIHYSLISADLYSLKRNDTSYNIFTGKRNKADDMLIT